MDDCSEELVVNRRTRVSIKIGTLNKSISIKGKYNLNWFDFQEEIKCWVIKI